MAIVSFLRLGKSTVDRRKKDKVKGKRNLENHTKPIVRQVESKVNKGLGGLKNQERRLASLSDDE